MSDKTIQIQVESDDKLQSFKKIIRIKKKPHKDFQSKK